MRLNRPAGTRRFIGMTPLIDVVFLLLVFFMLASTFLRFGSVELRTAGAGEGAADRQTIALIYVEPDRAVNLNGTEVAPGALPAALRAQQKAGRTNAVLVLRKRASVDDLVFVTTQVRRSGFASVSIAN